MKRKSYHAVSFHSMTSTLRVLSIALLALNACVDAEPEPDLGTEAQGLAAREGQGWDLQGWDLQGWDLQGWDLQGWDLQGWDLQGGYYSNAALTAASASGTALEVWRKIYVFGQGYRLEQRLPDRRCIWSLEKTTNYGCTYPNLANEPSPLSGVKLKGTFTGPNGATLQAYVRIGTDTTTVGSVTKGFGTAMFPLVGNTNAAGCGVVAVGGVIDAATGEKCMHPNGCRRNCDLWLYDIDVIMPDGETVNGCPGTQKAVLVPGSYSASGSYSSTSTSVTFSCESGTIAKCTRWGYRPWGSARRNCNGASCGTDTTLYSLLNYHRSCVRAAMADYCANGTPFTKLGTLVDIYDYEATDNVGGFIPNTRSLVTNQPTTAFQWESRFDRYGATQLDHLRYQELSPTLAQACAGHFYQASDDALQNWNRESPAWVNPSVRIDSTTACSHSEFTVGKWLHRHCSACTGKVDAYCTNPGDSRGWDSSCVAQASARCTSNEPPMTAHSECLAAGALPKFATGCTLRVCMDNPSCCTSSWDSTCVAKAKAVCTGGQERVSRFSNFCTGIYVNPSPIDPPPGNHL